MLANSKATLQSDSRLLECSSSFLKEGMYLRYVQVSSIKIVDNLDRLLTAHQMTCPCVCRIMMRL